MTRFLLRHRLSSTLPRKFKIAFEGCAERSHRDRRSTISASARVLGPNGEPRLPRHRRRRHRDHVHATRACCTSFCRRRRSSACAEAVLRVCSQQLGDYQHKQRNRMKFMIKELGWIAWREEYDRALAALPARRTVALLEIGPARLGVDSPTGCGTRRRRPARSALRVRRARRATGRASAGRSSRSMQPGDEAYARWRTTNVAPEAEAVRLLHRSRRRAARRLDERADARDRRARARVQRRHGARHAWSRISCSAGCKSADVRPLYRRLAAAGLGLAEAGTIAKSPAAPARSRAGSP